MKDPLMKKDSGNRSSAMAGTAKNLAFDHALDSPFERKHSVRHVPGFFSYPSAFP
jgi:hypothetical protein